MRTKLLAFLLTASLVTGLAPGAFAEEPPATEPFTESVVIEHVPAEEEVLVTEDVLAELPVETEVPSEKNDILAPEVASSSLSEGEEVLEVAAPIEAVLETTEVTLEIHTGTNTLRDGTIAVAPCSPREEDAASISGYCAIEQSGRTATWSWFGSGAFLNTIDQVGNGSGSDNYWMWFSDGEPGLTGLNQHTLRDGETITVTIDRMPIRLTVEDASPEVGTPTTITVEGFDAWDFAYEPLSEATVSFGGATVTTNSSGQATVTATSTGSLTLTAAKDGYLPEEARLAPVDLIPDATITLEVHTKAGTLFNDELTVSACAESPESTTTTVNGYCAIEQSGLDAEWSWYGHDAFINSIEGVGNDYAANDYWGWFANDAYGQTALNKHALSDGDRLVVSIGVQPLALAPAAPVVGTTTILTVTEFGFEGWDAVWSPASGALVTILGETHTAAADGSVPFVATSTDPVRVTVTKEGFIAISRVLSPVLAGGPGDGSGGDGDNSGPGRTSFDPTAAFSFLKSGQNADGSWDTDIITDWTAIALASRGAPSDMKAALVEFLREEDVDLDTALDYERHAMALMALGINPYTGGPEDYITPIVESFDGTQIDEPGLVNDDAFALITLLNAGYSEDDEIIRKIAAFVVSRQRADGSWTGGVDVSGPYLQALAGVRSLPGVPAALARAEAYLRSAQKPDGGFGDPFATSWAVQGLVALGEDPQAWKQGDHTPLTYLAQAQAEDGGLVTAPDDYLTRAWGTAYAIPAVKGLTWDDLLRDFRKPATPKSDEGNENSVREVSNGATTTAEDIAPLPPEPVITEMPAPFTAQAAETTPSPEVAVVTPAATVIATAEPGASASEKPLAVQRDLTASVADSGALEWLKQLFSGFWSFLRSLFS